MIYFVYKFRVKKSGLFYVGITTNIDARKVEHWSGIHIAVKLSSIRKPILPGYSKIVEYFLTKSDINYKIVKNIVSFKIIDIKDTKQEALELERSLIKKYISNPKFLNVKLA